MKKYFIITLLAILALTVQAQETIKIVPKFKVGQKMTYHALKISSMGVPVSNTEGEDITDQFLTADSTTYDLEVSVLSKSDEGWKISTLLKNFQVKEETSKTADAFTKGVASAFGMDKMVGATEDYMKGLGEIPMEFTLDNEGKLLRYDNEKQLKMFFAEKYLPVMKDMMKKMSKLMSKKERKQIKNLNVDSLLNLDVVGKMLDVSNIYCSFLIQKNDSSFTLGKSEYKTDDNFVNLEVSKQSSGWKIEQKEKMVPIDNGVGEKPFLDVDMDQNTIFEYDSDFLPTKFFHVEDGKVGNMIMKSSLSLDLVK